MRRFLGVHSLGGFESKNFQCIEAADFGAVRFGSEIEELVEQFDIPLILLHTIAQRTPEHPVGSESVEDPAGKRLQIFVRVGLTRCRAQAGELHHHVGELAQLQYFVILGRRGSVASGGDSRRTGGRDELSHIFAGCGALSLSPK